MAGTTRQTFNLTHGDGLLPSDRKKLVHLLCEALQTRFEDATQGVVEDTSVADLKIWPLDKAELEGFVYTSL